jgi:hypothetical protein
MKDILSRYARTEDGRFIIDVYTERLEDLYNDFDRRAPYMKKDLEPEFVDYLIGCAGEIGKHPFIIRINLPSAHSEEAATRVRSSIPSYFTYLRSAEEGDMRKVLRTSTTLLIIGLAILVLSVWAHQAFLPPDSLAGKVMAEGLTVAAWVSLWEALVNFLINWPPHNSKLRLYRHLAEASVDFQHLN